MKLLEGYWREKENFGEQVPSRERCVCIRQKERENRMGEVPQPNCSEAEDTFAAPCCLGVLSMVCSRLHLPGLLPTLQQGSGVGSLPIRPGGPALGRTQTQIIRGL